MVLQTKSEIYFITLLFYVKINRIVLSCCDHGKKYYVVLVI